MDTTVFWVFFFVGFVCSFLFSPDKSNLNFLFMTEKKLRTFPTPHQKAVHTSGLSPSAHAIQQHFESKLVSIKQLDVMSESERFPTGNQNHSG